MFAHIKVRFFHPVKVWTATAKFPWHGPSLLGLLWNPCRERRSGMRYRADLSEFGWAM